MAGPADWGAVAVDQPQQDGPAAWGAQPVEQPQQPPQQSNLADKLGPIAFGAVAGPAAGELTYRLAKQAILGLPGQLERLKAVETGQASPEQEGELAANAALSTVSFGAAEQFGTARTALAKTVAPAIKEFQDTVIDPAIRKIASDATPIVPNAPDHVQPILNEPSVRDAILNGAVNRDNHVPYEAGATNGSDTTNVDKGIPAVVTHKGQTWDTAPGLKIHEQVEDFVAKKLIEGGMDRGTAYSVSHWEYAEPAEDAYYTSRGLDPDIVEDYFKNQATRIQKEPGTDLPPELAQYPYPHDSLSLAREGGSSVPKPTPEQVDQAQQILGKTGAEIANPLQKFFEARELGVIGDEPQPNINRMPPKDAAARVMPALRRRDETISGDVEQPNTWRQRFESTLDKMETPEDARVLIRNALDRNNDFEPARQGYISAAQTEKLGDVTGLDPQHIDVAGTSRKIKTNEEMRNVVQAFRAINDKIQDAAQALTAKGGVDDEGEVEAFTRLRLQRDALLDAAVEPFVALRAEFGRAGNVLQEFMKIKRAAGDQMRIVRDQTGHRIDDLRDEARMISSTPVEDVPRVLEKMRRDTIGPVYWNWIQGLISGWLTHTKYFAANELYSDIERGVMTPIAATIGKAKQLAGIDTDRVLFGETAAGLWGQIASIPKAIYVAGKAVKAGVRVPLDDEIALYRSAIERGEKVPTPIQKIVEASQIPAQRGVTGEFVRETTEPIVGEKAAQALGYGWSRLLGAPGDMASAIHTIYKVRGRQAAMESLAYRKAASEGLSPVTPEFWQRQQWHVANPTDEMRVKAVAEAYNATFMGELSPNTKQLAGAVRKNKYLKWIFPFMHIPVKLLEAFQGYTPLAALNPEMRDALMGRNGGAEQDKALARLVVGTGIMGYVYHKFMMGRATGDYPQDQKERKLWQDTGKQPNSILIGDHWVSFDRFGTVGDLARMGANLGHAAQLWQQDGKVGDSLDQQLGDFAGALALSAVRLVTDEVGFQTIQRAVEAWDDREKWNEFIGMEASSFIQFSSGVSQFASGGVPSFGAGGDPYMRKIHGMWDAIKYRLPGARETLPVKRDWMGMPVPNPQYGNILRQTQATQDPVRLELARLGVTPGPARGYIGHVKLSQQDYDRYVGTAAPLIQSMLRNRIQSQRYLAEPDQQKIADIHKDIATARGLARRAMQAHQLPLVDQGLAQRRSAILGPR